MDCDEPNGWRNAYDALRDVAVRYLELYDRESKSKINGALVVLNYSIQDLSRFVSSARQGERSLALFYQLLIKTDALVGACEVIVKELHGGKHCAKDWRVKFWADGYRSIRYFRLIRSLVLAHPLETDRFPDEGFGKDGKWCEDVRLPGRFQDDTGDYVLIICDTGETLGEHFQVSIENDVVKAIDACVMSFDRICFDLRDGITKKESELRNRLIDLDSQASPAEYAVLLKDELALRYPSWIERYEVDDGFTVEHSILDEAITMLGITFDETKAEERFSSYRNAVADALYDFAGRLQNMSLPECGSRDLALEKVLYPDASSAMDLSSSPIKIYCAEKITCLLRGVNEKPCKNAFSNKFGTGGRVGKSTDLDWGAMCFNTLSDIIEQWFPIVFDATGQQLYAQFVAAAYFSQNNE